MEKTKKTATANQNQSGGNFLSPVPLEEFKNHIAEVFLLYVQGIAWMIDPKVAWSLTRLPAIDQPEFSLLDPDCRPSEMGITFDSISETPLARVLIALYDYAYFGRQDMTRGEMEDESEYTWITAMLVDASSGALSHEWHLYGSECLISGSKCVQVAQIANARVILEGGEAFYVFQDSRGFSDGGSAGLSIKQLALVAGMEEMSVRAAANPKRPSPLETTNSNGSTSIPPDVAKKWLQSKGRYIPISRHWGKTEVDLSARGFSSDIDLLGFLDSMYRNLEGSDEFETATKSLIAIGLKPHCSPLAMGIDIPLEAIAQAEIQDGLARIFNLDRELFVLRVREMLATVELARVGRAIRDRKSSKTDVTTTT